MALREFRDRSGVEWRVWAVTPASMHPATASELFLGEYQEGWLTFESANARRRLARFPADWDQLSNAQLEALGASARDAPFKRSRETASGEYRRVAESTVLADHGVTGSPASHSDPSGPRTFVGPSGREWSVAVRELSPGEMTAAGEPASVPHPVLRFTSSDLVLDLERWPEDWERLTNAQLIELAQRAQMVPVPAPPGTPVKRRREDQRV